MTIGWSEALIILVVLAFLVGLAFRAGVTRGRGRRGGGR
jgi:Sec-independent protein translocase protein TatA